MAESNYAVHPGAFWREALEECQVSQARAADAIGISRKHLNAVVRGKVLPSAPQR